MDKVSTFVVQKNAVKVKVDPLVLVTILDSYARRPKKEGRAIGTLMGTMAEGNLLEISDCFQVVHSDSAEKGLLFDSQYHGRMCKLRQTVHPREQVVGWFSVGEEKLSEEYEVQIHNFYRSKESKWSAFLSSSQQGSLTSPIYLQVDTTIRESDTPIEIKAYSTDFVAGTENSLMQFYEMVIVSGGTDIASQDANIMDMLAAAAAEKYAARSKKSAEISTLDSFSRQLDLMETLIEKAQSYISNVLEGKEKPNPEVGRALMRCLQAEKEIADSDVKLNDIVNGAMKDTLMVSYLSELCKTQIVLAEKIQGVLAPPQE